MRVYLASTLPALAEARATGGVVGAPLTVHAVTPTLREWYAESDLEELEHAAFLDAARSSLRLLAADPLAPRRRVVLAADLADASVRPMAHNDSAGLDGTDDARSAVEIEPVVPMAVVASIHVDEPSAADDVTAAVEASAAADRGDEDAMFVGDGADDHDLLWYDVTEIADILGSV
jgi:hypothetical protein